MSLGFSAASLVGLPHCQRPATKRICSANEIGGGREGGGMGLRYRYRYRRASAVPVLMCAVPGEKQQAGDNTCVSDTVTRSEIVLYSERRGFRVKQYAAGPVCKLDLFIGDELYAFVTGIIMPTGWLHIESYKAKPKSGGGLLSVTPGMLVFMYALAFGVEKGSKEVYGLAIDDGAKQHTRLKRYLKKYGGKEVRKITESIHSIGDKLLYGGNGTIIKADIPQLMKRSRDMLDRSEQTARAAK